MTIRQIFLDGNYNCAEAVLLWANQRYGLDIPLEDVRLVSGFGGGMGCGEDCGALLGAMAALSKRLVTDRAHETAGLRESCAGLVDRFRADLGSIQCAELKPKYRRPDVRCLYVVERAAAILEEYMSSLEGTPHEP